MKTFRNSDIVKIGRAGNIPLRYQGRTAVVVGRERVGRGFRYLVNCGARRVAPLEVAARFLTLA